MVMNWGCVIANHRNARQGVDKYHSIVFPIGAFFVIVGLGISPWGYHHALWLIFALDPGTYVMLAGIVFALHHGLRGKGS